MYLSPSRWFHGHLSGSNAEKFLWERDEPGTFLVRESLSKPGDFVLSVLTEEKSKTANGGRRVSHIKLMCQVQASVLDCVCVCVWTPEVMEKCEPSITLELCVTILGDIPKHAHIFL